MIVRFARRHSSADEMIEELLESWPSPRSLVVVSSDHRVQRAARQCGATYIDSDQWYAEVRAAGRRHDEAAEEPPAKQSGSASADELAYWLHQFQDVPDDDEEKSPFPPGYGDDLADD
jgi:predicted RNA-binding protein with PIN domain